MIVAAPAAFALAKLSYGLPDKFRKRLEKSTLPSNNPMGGDKKKSLQSLYLTTSDHDLLDAIDRMKFNGEGGENRATSSK